MQQVYVKRAVRGTKYQVGVASHMWAVVRHRVRHSACKRKGLRATGTIVPQSDNTTRRCRGGGTDQAEAHCGLSDNSDDDSGLIAWHATDAPYAFWVA